MDKSYYQFIDEKGTFCLKNAENYSYLYFPIAGDNGIKSAVTPNLSGDCKIDQNTFVLEPVSAENLHNNRSSRNFWCHVENMGNWSATGVSAEEQGKKFTALQDKSEVTAGLMWHIAERESEKYRLHARITSTVTIDGTMELMYVEITNSGNMHVNFTPTAAIPLYGRSADNIRDHRHVTSLLHRIRTTEAGVEVTPTLSFDERGHQINDVTYFVYGYDENGNPPQDFYPIVCDYIGEGGSFERPQAVVENKEGVKAGAAFAGFEAIGGLHFKEVSLAPQETARFTIMIGAIKAGSIELKITNSEMSPVSEYIKKITEPYSKPEAVKKEYANIKEYWEQKVNVSYRTGDREFDGFMHWVSFQPILRRIYGCSFLPHHDYGKGGRGWRDLWQDCLALLIMNPEGVRQMLLDNFGGVRMDGTNATIIGSRPGEFVADRNNITRVWMDHGVWPFLTTKFYLDQTGDCAILNEQVPYFKDKQVARGEKTDGDWNDAYGLQQKTKKGELYCGSVLEHLLLQNLTAFYEVGEHGNIRLRGADWNDALDMAAERGESVAFTNAYAGNLRDLADLVETYGKKEKCDTVLLLKELGMLLFYDKTLYDSVTEKQKQLADYGKTCMHNISGEKQAFDIAEVAKSLRSKADWMMEHIRANEWVTDEDKDGWFNGYYDNHGQRVEGEFEQGVRMMLTGQVFSIMAGTANEEQVAKIAKSADKYLYRENAGGYCLNTDFKEVKTDLGRMFGFAYGEKENGAVFSHMAVMYANALYKRGFVKEGYKALNALEKQAMNFEVSKIYPGIPEYFNSRGRGMYHYLTGAASWFMLTVITEMFGVKGVMGDLCMEPKLMAEQFDKDGKAELSLLFAEKTWHIVYENKQKLAYGVYQIMAVSLDGKETKLMEGQRKTCLLKEKIAELAANEEHEIVVVLA